MNQVATQYYKGLGIQVSEEEKILKTELGILKELQWSGRHAEAAMMGLNARQRPTTNAYLPNICPECGVD